MNTLTISQPTFADIDTMWKWGEENWELWGDEKNKWFSKKSLNHWINNPEDDILLGAYDNAKLVGMCMVSVMQSWAFCFGLFVDEKYRGQGIGKKLLDKASAILRQKDIRSFCLLVDTKNKEATKFYTREGFYKGYEFFMMTKDLKEEI